jgi:AraC family transcriptional regulator of arabinose operon
MPAESFHPEVDQILTGHFREQGEYATYRSRGTRDYLLIYTAGGRGRFGYARGEIITQRGDLVLVAPGALHDYGLASPPMAWELLWAHFVPPAHLRPWLGLPAVAHGLMRMHIADPELRARVEQRLLDMHRLGSGPLRLAKRLALNALEEVLLWCDLDNPESAQSVDPRIRRALELLARDPKAPFSLVELASRCGISRSRLSQLFREQVGMTPQQYHETQRIELARQLLLLTSRNVAQVADDVGYTSPFYFSLRFKKATGQSPSEYRRGLVA